MDFLFAKAQLPEGWARAWSEAEKDYYFWNKATKEVTWSPPKEDRGSAVPPPPPKRPKLAEEQANPTPKTVRKEVPVSALLSWKPDCIEKINLHQKQLEKERELLKSKSVVRSQKAGAGGRGQGGRGGANAAGGKQKKVRPTAVF